MDGKRDVRDFGRKVYRFLKRRCNDVLFITRNILGSLSLENIPKLIVDGQRVICGASIKELKEALYIFVLS
jgi:hypothetical protein